jgi:hypothetical protein
MNTKSYMKKPAASTIISTTNEGTYEGVARVAFDIGQRIVADLRRIRDALDAGNDSMALALMREFFVLHGDGRVDEKRTATQ